MSDEIERLAASDPNGRLFPMLTPDKEDLAIASLAKHWEATPKFMRHHVRVDHENVNLRHFRDQVKVFADNLEASIIKWEKDGTKPHEELADMKIQFAVLEALLAHP
jgi:hypothetical protein